jgi:hypothetical protein
MSKSNDALVDDTTESVFKSYILDVRIVDCHPVDADGPRYRFEAPQHTDVRFEDPDLAELYADIYFDVNGFQEAGTGDRGVPPEIIQAGKDTVAAYLLTMPGTDVNWVASFYGVKPTKIERYVSWVHDRAEEIRTGARQQGME